MASAIPDRDPPLCRADIPTTRTLDWKSFDVMFETGY
jgi:hypothetical protein